MADETTPLLQRTPVAAHRQRYPHQILRRVCTALLVSTCVLVPVLFFAPFNIPWAKATKSRESPQEEVLLSDSWLETNQLPFKDLLKILYDTPNEGQVKEWSSYYTSGPHLAGKNLSQAEWTRDKWQEFGVADSSIVSYDVYINYPKGHRLALLDVGPEDGESVRYEAKLEEDVLKEDPTSGLKDRVPTFHGYSASGDVTAQYVFANYGTFYDFEDLVAAGTPLSGKIALVKYGRIFRGLKVKRAQELGMVGVVMYSDPGDDEVTEETAETYPYGPAREPSSVQRGSVQYLSVAPGDPTTPGYPSKPGVPRQGTENAIPEIPSLPISYEDALPLLRALNGYGQDASSFNQYWQTGGLGYKGIKYNIGPSPPGTVLNLVNQQEYVTNPLWNVIGIINGTMSDEVIIIGNHRDAWIAGGAADPNSGSAALNEVVRAFGKALKAGWKPFRTIVIASWDGEEYGLVGSTEWVEEYLPWLSGSAVAYLNVDVAVRGPQFETSASPLLHKLLDTTYSISSANQTKKDQTVGDLWDGKIRTMGSGSDFTAFQDYTGIPSLDMGFSGSSDSPVYHYHSNFDSWSWMSKFGDPGWHYHVSMARLWAVMTARLVDTPIIPFNATDYADALRDYAIAIEEKATTLGADRRSFSLHRLKDTISRLRRVSVELDARAAELSREIELVPGLPWYGGSLQKRILYRQARKINQQYKFLERQFLFEKGLDGRSWFKHTIFAPGLWTGYAGATFPGLVESLEANNKSSFDRWKGIITGQVYEAVTLLEIGN